MRALVTGGAGFVGRALVDALRARGHEVVSLDLVEGPGVTLGSVENAAGLWELCRGVEVVFHTAARACLGGTRQQFERANVEGTSNVLEACRRAGVRRLVYTSSASVVFDGHDLEDVDETLPLPRRHLNHYCATKAAAERLVVQAGGVALRPHLIWGVGERKLLPALLDLGRRGLLKRVGSGSNRIDTTHVTNVVHAHLLAAEAPVEGRTFLVTDGEPTLMWGWVDELLAGLGHPPVRGRLPLALVYAAGWLCESVYRAVRPTAEPPLTRYLAAQLGRTHTSSIAAARRELGYEPLVSRQQGMQELLRDLRGQVAKERGHDP